MSVDLVRLEDAERLSISNQQWAFILTSAENNGWKPLGTTKLDDEGEVNEDWDTSDYSSNDGQVVDSDDCMQLDICCKKALIKSKDDKWEMETLEKFIQFVSISEDNELYYPGFEIW